MRSLWCAVAVLVSSSAAGAATWCVDGRNLSGVTDGSAARPFVTVQAAVDAAAAGDTVAVAVGHYREAVHVHGKGLRLLGGYVGATSYGGTTTGDFSTRTDDPSATRIEGVRTAPVVRLTDAPASTLDGFRLTGGQRGVLVDGEAWPSVVADVVIAHNLVESNGVTTEHGGGIHALGQRLRIVGNTVRANVGANGAGIYLHHCSDVLVDGNTVESNLGHNDHGGGLLLNGSGTVSRNVFRANRIGETVGYGWGGGVLVVEAHAAPALLRGNLYTDNYAPGAGGAVFVDEGATATLDHELIVGNRCRGEGGGVYVDASWDGRRSRATIVSCTIADNVADVWPGTGAGIYVQGSDVVLRDSIVWGNTGLGGPDDFAVVDGGTLVATYTLSREGLPGIGNLSADPLFTDPAGGDYHLRSRAGRWNPVLSTWVVDPQSSPGIDAGDPTQPFALEPEPNGGRVNLGFEGNTVEASKTISATTGRVRRHLERMCGGPLPMPAWPTSGYLLEMEAVGEVFRVWVTSAAGVQHVQTWLAAGPAVETLGIPGAPIELDGTFNPGYGYRLRPGEVAFGENWIELCDGTPCGVQDHAAEWVANPSMWCPWAARIRSVWSCSGGTGGSCGAPVFVAPGRDAREAPEPQETDRLRQAP
ncbi:MAG: right-handed parallel beta-helix repeat-containing protein [Thermoanaerobaculaceae bacterium]